MRFHVPTPRALAQNYDVLFPSSSGFASLLFKPNPPLWGPSGRHASSQHIAIPHPVEAE
jgi:hypothetical protein